jgi:FKBP-type peptidyl-prolyl cis-trans isomerase
MKKITLIACAVFLLAACNNSKSGKKPVMKTAKDSFSYAFGAYNGSMLHNFKINEIDWELFKAALEDGLKNGDSALAIDRETIGKVLQSYTVEAQFGANRIKGAEYIAKQKSNGYTSTPSGLLFKQIKAGSGVKPNITDTVLVHYTGKFTDGKVFDSNDGKEAFKTALNGGAVPGFLEGLSMMEVGSTAEVVIPWNLGYGSEGMRNPYTGEMSIEPFTTLIFTVTLDGIKN